MDDSFVAHNSPFKLGVMLAAVVAFLLADIAPQQFGLLPEPWFVWLQWPFAFLLVMAAAVLMADLLDRRGQLVVNLYGVIWRRWSDEIIPWEEVSHFSSEKQYVGSGLIYLPYLCLCLKDPARHPRTKWRARFFGRPWNLGYGNITVSTVGLDKTVNEVLAAMRGFAPDKSRVIGGKEGSAAKGDKRRSLLE